MENMRFDVTALGELLIDFTDNGKSGQGNSLFEANPGGAPCNVLAFLKKLGRSCAFVGKVGDDLFGHLLRDVAAEAGICMDYLVFDKDVRTTLAFVQTFANGDRDFSFYRSPGADRELREDELPLDVIASSRIFHFGSLSMTHDGVRRATRKAIKCAKAGGALLSFDPNLRQPLREKHPNIRLFNVTAGADGSYSYYEDKRVFVPACKLGGTIETTGAGDTFCAGVLSFVLERGLEGLTEADLTEMLRFANTAAYIVTTRKGAIRSMPEREQVLALLREN